MHSLFGVFVAYACVRFILKNVLQYATLGMLNGQGNLKIYMKFRSVLIDPDCHRLCKTSSERRKHCLGKEMFR